MQDRQLMAEHGEDHELMAQREDLRVLGRSLVGSRRSIANALVTPRWPVEEALYAIIAGPRRR
jgi:hypothetical protein